MPFRVFLLLIALLFSASSAAPAAAQSRDAEKFWVFFTHKKPNAEKTIQRVPIDERARSRRATRGRISGNWIDLPVSGDYVAAVREIASEVLVESRWFNAVSVRATPRQRALLNALSFVDRVQRVASLRAPDPVLEGKLLNETALKRSDLDYGPSRRQLAFVNAIPPLEALDERVNGAGVRIGFLDTKFNFSHPALSHIVDSGRLIEVRDFTTPNQTEHGSDQSNFHGLNVTSIALGYDPGNLIGPAHGAEVLAGTTEFAPTETNQEEDNLVAGLEWLEAEGVDVVNVSLGYTTFDQGEHSYSTQDMDGDTGITTIAADMAAQLGVVMVISAGNSGSDPWRIIGTPADGDSVITVGAASVDSTLAAFSSVGPTADGRIKPDVSAMGVSVVVAVPSGGYSAGSGTSFSSPMVAGVVAQMLQVNPALDPTEVLGILRETSSRAESPDNQLGWGIVDASAAVEEARMRATARHDDERDVPSTATLQSAYPNPFTDHVTFRVVGPAGRQSATLTLHDPLGRRVQVLFEGSLSPGINLIIFRPQHLASGAYFYRLVAGRETTTGALFYLQ